MVGNIEDGRFWKCIGIFLRNYHAVNKKIFASKIKKIQRVGKELKEIDVETQTAESIHKKLHYNLTEATEADLFKHLNNFEGIPNDFGGFFIIITLLNKRFSSNVEAIGIIDFNRQLFVCKYNQCIYLEDICVKLCDKRVEVYSITNRVNAREDENNWCQTVLRPKLLKWLNSLNKETLPSLRSLQLIDLEIYNDLYKQLKRKYASKISEFWAEAKESTDPLKFIYEDLAIASYLICLWRLTASSPQAFADLGCGNGLLVYILNEEGFKGYGFDISIRRLWSCYPKDKTHLIQQAIDPEHFTLPPEVDWLIGNHSDELSPWLPVLAGTASYKMCFFLLPCCAYEFSGSKFQRRHAGVSVYCDFMQYLKDITIKCGFKTLQDRLKIPSTKRLALIGIDRYYKAEDFGNQTKSTWEFVQAEILTYGKQNSDSKIKLRNQCQPVKNCTQIDGNIIEELVLKIFNILLNQSLTTSHNVSSDSWQIGIPMRMRSIVEKLSIEDLKHIKSECGGIKTLLRNKHEIFKFCEKDMVVVRKPEKRIYASEKPQTIKKRTCFFQKHHPNGCPLASEDCTFIHA